MSQIQRERKSIPTYEANLLPTNGALTACSNPTVPLPRPTLLTQPCLNSTAARCPGSPLAVPSPGPDDKMLMAGVAHSLAGTDGEQCHRPLRPSVLRTCWLQFRTKKGK